jgi:hypothetical protein
MGSGVWEDSESSSFCSEFAAKHCPVSDDILHHSSACVGQGFPGRCTQTEGLWDDRRGIGHRAYGVVGVRGG